MPRVCSLDAHAGASMVRAASTDVKAIALDKLDTGQAVYALQAPEKMGNTRGKLPQHPAGVQVALGHRSLGYCSVRRFGLSTGPGPSQPGAGEERHRLRWTGVQS